MRKPTNYYERERRRGRIYSAVAHLLCFLLAYFGLPSFLLPRPPEEPPVISVEILPITGITNVKPSETPPAPEKKPEEKTPDQAKPSPPVKTSEPVPPPPEEKVVEKPNDKAEPKKEDKKPEPKKEKKKQEDDLAAILKAVKDTAQKEKKEDKKKDKKEDGSTSKSVSDKYNPELPMSMSEKDAIMSQLAKCWIVPAGAKDAQNLVVVIDAEYANDGSYLKVTLADESRSRYDSDSFFRAAADSALRAVKECSPLKDLPPEKYETWRSMELRFDPKYMLN